MDVRKVIKNITKKYSEIKWGFTTKNFSLGSKDGFFFNFDMSKMKKEYSNAKGRYLLLNGFTDTAIDTVIKECPNLKNYLVITEIKDVPENGTIQFTQGGKEDDFIKEIGNSKPYIIMDPKKFYLSHIFKVIDDDGNESLDEVQKFLKKFEKKSNKPMESDKEEKMNSNKENSEYKLPSVNTILYGPPGTGKTYNSVKYAVDTIDGKFSQDGTKTYADYINKFNELKAAGRIAFTTFHQSYGYEEFIEGIKPVLGDISEKNDLGYKISDGVF